MGLVGQIRVQNFYAFNATVKVITEIEIYNATSIAGVYHFRETKIA